MSMKVFLTTILDGESGTTSGESALSGESGDSGEAGDSAEFGDGMIWPT